MASLFSGSVGTALTLATTPAPPASYAKHLNGKDRHVVIVGDDEVILSDLDWQL
jgi:hypothetical protein